MDRIMRREFLKRTGAGIGAFAVARAWPRWLTAATAYAQGTGTLTYGMAGGFDTLDVTTTTFTRVGRIGLHIVDPLVWATGPGRYAPGLATSWTVSPDATVYTFKLREDVKFHDGTPFDAEAVKVTFDRIVDPNTRAQTAFSFIGPYDRTEIVDRYTVRVRFKSGHASFLNAASSPYLGIISPTAVRKYGPDFGRVVFVGTGPFMLQSYRTDAEVRLIRNPNYAWGGLGFHQGRAYLEGIVFRIVPEEATRVATLDTGETLFIEDVPVTDYQRFKTSRDKVLLEIPQAGSGWSLMMNQGRAPTDDIAVRRAMMHAVDKEGLARTVWNGVFKPACSPLTPNMFGFDPETCRKVPFNQDQARRILDEAGWRLGPDGIRVKGSQRLRLEFYLQTTPQKNIEMASFIQANAKQVGIEVNLNVLARPAYLDAVRQGRHNLQFWWDTGTDPGQMLRILFHSRNAGGGTNRNNYRSAEMDRLIEQIDATADPAKRRELVVRAQQRAIDDAVMVYLADPPSLYAHDRSLTGVWVDWGGNYPYFFNARIQR